MVVMLLRVAIDTGTDGALGPIFSDGSFEFIPISEHDCSTKEDRTYANTIGRHGKPLSTYLPPRIAGRTMHNDPEFKTFTYGDPTAKRRYLLKLKEGDLLAFYAGLAPYMNDKYDTALYIIGYFTVKKVINFNVLNAKQVADCHRAYPNNAHLKRGRAWGINDLVIVVGDKKKSGLLDKAAQISAPKIDRAGKRYHAVSPKMEKFLGISGSIQRSIPPRFITNEKNVANLKRILKL